jgi:DNA-directed RNA polymerase subunit RPC12/RpoP
MLGVAAHCVNCGKEISQAEARLYFNNCSLCGSLGILDLLF